MVLRAILRSVDATLNVFTLQGKRKKSRQDACASGPKRFLFDAVPTLSPVVSATEFN